MGVTCTMNVSTHNVHVNKPCWGPINRERIWRNYGYTEFVTTPGAFNLNFPKNHDFYDLGKAVMKILNSMCSNGPGR